jgi:hypothetical protein
MLLSASVAYAATSAATWGGYRVDLIRCADAASICGSAVTGTDPLSSGRITLDSSSVSLRLRGASPEKYYKVVFVALNNTGTLAGGPFNVLQGGAIQIGTVVTDKHGNASATYKKSASVNPRLGFFYISHSDPEVPSSPASYEFVTGIDQN